MRRFGSTERFLELLDSARALAPEAGARSNFIVGFPGETRADVDELVRFLTEARLDAIGVFDYSDEDGTEAAGMPGKVARGHDQAAVRPDQRARRRAVRASGPRTGSARPSTCWSTRVDDGVVEGRAAHQAPEVDGSTTLVAGERGRPGRLRPGDLVRARVTGTEGVDLVAVPVEMISAASAVTRRDRCRAAAPLPVPLLNAGQRAHRACASCSCPVFVAAGDRLRDDRRRLADRGLPDVRRRVARPTSSTAGSPGGTSWSPPFGKVADPIADKALTGTALVLLSAYDRLPWWVTVLILVREWGVTAAAVLGHPVRRDRRPAAAASSRRRCRSLAIAWYLWPVPAAVEPVGPVDHGRRAVVTVVTGLDYVLRALRLRRDARPRLADSRRRGVREAAGRRPVGRTRLRGPRGARRWPPPSR